METPASKVNPSGSYNGQNLQGTPSTCESSPTSCDTTITNAGSRMNNVGNGGSSIGNEKMTPSVATPSVATVVAKKKPLPSWGMYAKKKVTAPTTEKKEDPAPAIKTVVHNLMSDDLIAKQISAGSNGSGKRDLVNPKDSTKQDSDKGLLNSKESNASIPSHIEPALPSHIEPAFPSHMEARTFEPVASKTGSKTSPVVTASKTTRASIPKISRASVGCTSPALETKITDTTVGLGWGELTKLEDESPVKITRADSDSDAEFLSDDDDFANIQGGCGKDDQETEATNSTTTKSGKDAKGNGKGRDGKAGSTDATKGKTPSSTSTGGKDIKKAETALGKADKKVTKVLDPDGRTLVSATKIWPLQHQYSIWYDECIKVPKKKKNTAKNTATNALQTAQSHVIIGSAPAEGNEGNTTTKTPKTALEEAAVEKKEKVLQTAVSMPNMSSNLPCGSSLVSDVSQLCELAAARDISSAEASPSLPRADTLTNADRGLSRGDTAVSSLNRSATETARDFEELELVNRGHVQLTGDFTVFQVKEHEVIGDEDILKTQKANGIDASATSDKTKLHSSALQPTSSVSFASPVFIPCEAPLLSRDSLDSNGAKLLSTSPEVNEPFAIKANNGSVCEKDQTTSEKLEYGEDSKLSTTSSTFTTVKSSYEDGLQHVADICSVQVFWKYWNMLELKQGILSVFRGDIKPLWEDPGNEKGGRWVMQFIEPKRKWEIFTDLVLGMIGGLFDSTFDEDDDEICGVVLSSFKNRSKVEVWNRRANDENLFKIDYLIRSLLQLEEANFEIEYRSHDGSLRKARKKGLSVGSWKEKEWKEERDRKEKEKLEAEIKAKEEEEKRIEERREADREAEEKREAERKMKEKEGRKARKNTPLIINATSDTTTPVSKIGELTVADEHQLLAKMPSEIDGLFKNTSISLPALSPTASTGLYNSPRIFGIENLTDALAPTDSFQVGSLDFKHVIGGVDRFELNNMTPNRSTPNFSARASLLTSTLGAPMNSTIEPRNTVELIKVPSEIAGVHANYNTRMASQLPSQLQSARESNSSPEQIPQKSNDNSTDTTPANTCPINIGGISGVTSVSEEVGGFSAPSSGAKNQTTVATNDQITGELSPYANEFVPTFGATVDTTTSTTSVSMNVNASEFNPNASSFTPSSNTTQWNTQAREWTPNSANQWNQYSDGWNY